MSGKDKRSQGKDFKKGKSKHYKKGGNTRKKFASTANQGSELIRLNKYIAHSGVCSRREADELIKSGVVEVNGKVVTEMGHKVRLTDEVKFGGRRINPEKTVYLLLNKPKNYITTSKDPRNRKTVMHLIQGACKERVYPVGRLDRNTTGLLLLTNDGELAEKLTHPSHGAKKIYHVTLDQNLKPSDMDEIKRGVKLEDGKAEVDDISYIEGQSNNEVGMELHSGKNRIIRRIFEHLGYKVVKLDRVYFAGLTKKDTPRGKWRMLKDREIAMLKMGKWE